jgi:serine/threonine protein kinase
MNICHTCRDSYTDDHVFCPRDGARLAAQMTEAEAQLVAGLSRLFHVVGRLGAGGCGTVFLAEQLEIGNRKVALKVLSRQSLNDSDFLRRFKNEAASAGRIRHTNVVTLYEFNQTNDGTPYIVMEFLEGESLRQALKRRTRFTVTEVAEILKQAARGLNAAHEEGIIHRDLKPENVMLTRGDDGGMIVKVVDFGIAKLRESVTHTLAGTVLGTPAYMSYEQASCMKSDELDARSDIYSLGVVTYEMLTGRLPFRSDTAVGYLSKHLHDVPLPFCDVASGLSIAPEVESAVMKALVKDREQRYASAPEFATALSLALNSSQLGREPAQLKPTVIVLQGTDDVAGQTSGPEAGELKGFEFEEKSQQRSPGGFSDEELRKTMSNPKYANDILRLDRTWQRASVIDRESVIIVVGTNIISELLDRSAAELLRDQIDQRGGKYPMRRGVIVTDEGWRSEAQYIKDNAVIAIGGPRTNRLTEEFDKLLPGPGERDGKYSIPGPGDRKGFFRKNSAGKPQVALWATTAIDTRGAIEHYVNNPQGLKEFLGMCWTSG